MWEGVQISKTFPEALHSGLDMFPALQLSEHTAKWKPSGKYCFQLGHPWTLRPQVKGYRTPSSSPELHAPQQGDPSLHAYGAGLTQICDPHQCHYGACARMQAKHGPVGCPTSQLTSFVRTTSPTLHKEPRDAAVGDTRGPGSETAVKNTVGTAGKMGHRHTSRCCLRC